MGFSVCVCVCVCVCVSPCSTHRHLDLNNLWIEDQEFTAGVYDTVVDVMQVLAALNTQ